MRKSYNNKSGQTQNTDYPTSFRLYEKNMAPYTSKTSQFKPQDFEENCFKEYFTVKKRKFVCGSK